VDAGGNAAPHDQVSAIFSDAFTHANGAPDFVGIVPNLTQVDANMVNNIFNLPTAMNGQDQYYLHAFVILDKPAILYDDNPNTGEHVGVYVGQCGCPPTFNSETEVETDTNNRGLGEFARLPAGVVEVVFQVSDLSASSGIRLSVSYDGGLTTTTLSDDQIYRTLPVQDCVPVWFCDDGNIYTLDKSEAIVLDPKFDSLCKTECKQCVEGC